MTKFFNYALVAVLSAALAGVGWLFVSQAKISSAAHFDESIGMVHHQTVQMGAKFDDAGAVAVRDISEIVIAGDLLVEWEPRYARAQTAFQKFTLAIDAAEERADVYFATQRALTQGYHDPARQQLARERDDTHYAEYEQWRDQAHSVRTQAQEIMYRLDDMDIDLRKLKLSAKFNVGEFREVPLAIKDLEAQLNDFQIASENIREITSPFGDRR